ncbi:MAG: hypothetical protein ACM3NO_05325 [Deltaproteobacteria bacterium]
MEIKADAQLHKVPKSSYSDNESVRIVNASTIEIIRQKAGRTTFTEIDSVSPDGNTLTQSVKDTTEAEPVNIETQFHRIDKGPPNSHAIPGSWLAYNVKRSMNGSIISYKCTTEEFHAQTPLGEKFTAKFDGKEYPVDDDPAHTMVSVKRLNPNTVEVTSKRNGKVVGISHMSVAPDGDSIHVVFDNRENNTKTSFEMRKQR